MSNMSKIDEKLTEFSEKVPAKGMHISYLEKAYQLINLYGEASSIMEDEASLENEKRIQEIVREIEEIVG